MEQKEIIDSNVRIAKAALIRARILRQRAVIEKELDWLYCEMHEATEVAPSLFSKAAMYRGFAKIALQRALTANKRLFDLGSVFAAYPLEVALNGRNFREWEQYTIGYQDDGQFQGVDPE